MTHEIKKEIKGFVALNPLEQVYHVGELDGGQVMTTGQPLLIVCDTLEEALNMAFTEYDKETGEGTPRQIDWLVLSTIEEAEALRQAISGFPSVEISYIPKGDKWLIPYADFFLDLLEDSDEKAALEEGLLNYLPATATEDLT